MVRRVQRQAETFAYRLAAPIPDIGTADTPAGNGGNLTDAVLNPNAYIPSYQDHGGAGPNAGANTGGSLLPTTQNLQNTLNSNLPGTDIGGYRPPDADGKSEHSSGQALDVMTSDPATAQKTITDAFKDPNTNYALWNGEQYNPDGTHGKMKDRGDPTQNHEDHVHLNVAPPKTGMADTTRWHPQIQWESKAAQRSMPTWGTYHITLPDPASTTGSRIAELKYSLSPADPRYRRNHDELHIDSLFVLPDHRGKGIAQALVERASQDHPNHRVNPGYTTPDGFGITERLRQTLDPNGEKLITNYEPYPLDPQDTDEYNEETLSRLLAAARLTLAMADTTMWHPRIEQAHYDGHAGWHQGTYRIRGDGGKTIGAMQYSMVPEVALISGVRPKSIIIEKVFVHPQHRSKGIAQSFIERLHNDFPDYKIDPGATTNNGNGFAEHLRKILPDAEHALIPDYTPNVMDDQASDDYDRTQRDYYRAYAAIQHAASILRYATALVVDPPTLECKHRTPCPPGACPQRDIAADPDFYAEFPDPADKEREFQDLYRLQSDDAPAPTAPPPPPPNQPARAILTEFLQERGRRNRRPITITCPDCKGYRTYACPTCNDKRVIVKPKTEDKLRPWAERLENALYNEFMEWWPTSEASRIRKPEVSGTKWEDHPKQPVTHWLNVEDFLNERYPEAATGSKFGGEYADPLLEKTVRADDLDRNPNISDPNYKAQPTPEWLESHGYIGTGNVITQAFLNLHNLHNRRYWKSRDDKRRTYELMLRHIGPDAVKRPKVANTLSADLVNRLQAEFDEWHGGDRVFREHHGRPGFGIGDWRNVEKFLKERYPAAHRGFDMGLEEARPLLRGEPNIVAKDFPTWYDTHPRNLADDKPYETGPDAVAQHGYDPKEIAAGMVLLHNRRNTESVFGTHRTRDNELAADVDFLNDIFQKRTKMQRQYEQRTVNA